MSETDAKHIRWLRAQRAEIQRRVWETNLALEGYLSELDHIDVTLAHAPVAPKAARRGKVK